MARCVYMGSVIVGMQSSVACLKGSLLVVFAIVDGLVVWLVQVFRSPVTCSRNHEVTFDETNHP